MRTFKIEISETLSRIIEVESDSVEEAITLVDEMYKSEEIILDDSNYIEYSVHEIIDNIN